MNLNEMTKITGIYKKFNGVFINLPGVVFC